MKISLEVISMRKDILIIGFVVLLIAVLFSGTKIQSVEDYYQTHIDDINEDSETVFITIEARTVLKHWDELDAELKDEKYIPRDGMILEKSEYVLRKNDTAFDVLKRATRHNQIHLDFQGASENSFNSAYIKGINHLYEFSCGNLSGWMYEVNGEFPDYGISRYNIEDGDELALRYTCDLGRDLENGININ